MCQSLAEGGKRCNCKATRTTYDRRINNRLYRSDLEAFMRARGQTKLADHISTASFTSIPDIVEAAGLDHAEVSIAQMPDKTKRHELTADDKKAVSAAKKLGKAREDARTTLARRYGISVPASDKDIARSINDLGDSERHQVASRMNTALADIHDQRHLNSGDSKATAALDHQYNEILRYTDQINHTAPGLAEVSRAKMISDPAYAAKNASVIREMSTEDLAQLWNNAAADTSGDSAPLLNALATEGSMRRSPHAGGTAVGPQGRDGVLLSQISNSELDNRREKLAASTDPADAEELDKINAEWTRRTGIETTAKQKKAVQQTRYTSKFRAYDQDRNRARSKSLPVFERTTRDERVKAFQSVLPKASIVGDAYMNPTVCDYDVERSKWHEAIKRGSQYVKGDIDDPRTDANGMYQPSVPSHVHLGKGRLVELPEQMNDADAWMHEYNTNVLDKGIVTKGQYLKSVRDDSTAKLTRKQREGAWEIMSNFTERSFDKGIFTPAMIDKLSEQCSKNKARSAA